MHGAERMDLFGEIRYDLLPFLAFGGRNPCIVESLVVNAQERQEPFKHFQPAPGVKVPVGIVAIPRMASGNENAIGTRDEGTYYKHGVNTARARDPDDPKVGRLLEPPDTGGISAAVGTPVTEKSNDSQFFGCYF